MHLHDDSCKGISRKSSSIDNLLFTNVNQVIYQEECCSKGQTEDHGAREVRLIHDAAVGCFQRMQHRQGLLPDVVKVDS